jgi:hypothetical protein
VVNAVLHRSLLLLAGGMRYAVAPEQDLTVDLSRIPALPRSGFVVEGIRAISAD